MSGGFCCWEELGFVPGLQVLLVEDFALEGFSFREFFCKGSFAFAWSVALVFTLLCIGGSFSAGSPFSAILSLQYL